MTNVAVSASIDIVMLLPGGIYASDATNMLAN